MVNVHIVLSDADIKALQEATHQSDPRRGLAAWVKRARRWRTAREQALAGYQPSEAVIDKALTIVADIDRRGKNAKSAKSASARPSRARRSS